MLDCWCDYDPATFYVRSFPKARKRHRCDECPDIILPGEHYENVSGLWDGNFSVWKTCERCHDLRQWVKNNVPCLCWAHGSTIDDCKEAINEAVFRAPQETVGLRFGFLRRLVLRDRFNAARKAA